MTRACVYAARQTEERPRVGVRRKGMLSDVEPEELKTINKIVNY